MLTLLQQTRKRYRDSHKAQRKVYQSAYYKRTIKHQRAYHYVKSYGLTIAQYNALLVAQHGKCLICGILPKDRRLVVDHDHKTDQVRGLLCFRCNAGLGFLDDSLWVAVAMDYLKMSQKTHCNI